MEGHIQDQTTTNRDSRGGKRDRWDSNPPKKARIEPEEIYSVINSFIIQHFSDYEPKFVAETLLKIGKDLATQYNLEQSIINQLSTKSNPLTRRFSQLQIRNKIEALDRSYYDLQQKNKHVCDHSYFITECIKSNNIQSYALGLKDNQEMSDFQLKRLREKMLVQSEFYHLLSNMNLKSG